MRILLLLPWEKDYMAYRDRFSTLLTYAPITLVTLAAFIPPELNAKVDICDEMVQKLDYKKPYDIVCISFVTPSSRRAYEIAQKFKEKGSYIVFGGYHTSFVPDEAEKHGDTIIIGQAEKSFPQFLRDFVKGKPEKRYEMPCVMPEDYRVPRRDLLPKRGYLNVPCVIADRGCPNRCEFCAISAMNSSNPRGVESVINEVKSLHAKRIIFFDPNFFQKRQYALELMSELEKLNIRWGSNATVTMAFDDELVKAASRSGCSGVLFGLESISRDSLLGAKKGFNDPKKYKQAIDIMHDYNISVNGCFVLGFDSDTKESLLSLPEQVEYLGVNLVRYAILTPVPNTMLYKRLESEGRILTKDWSRYTQNQAVFRPMNMTSRELEDIYVKVWKDSYRLPKMLRRLKSVSSLEFKMLVFGANLGFKYVGSNAGRG